MNVVVHPSFRPRLESLKQTLPHSSLLSGAAGSGLYTIAHEIAGGSALYLQPLDADGKPSQNGSISATSIRRLYEDTRSKHDRMIVIIDDADRLTLTAQGAFLKLLEEPSSNTHFILTSHQPDRLLPTIRSRLQHHTVPPISDTQTSDMIASYSSLTPEQQAQLRFLAHGRPALISRYASDSELFTNATTLVRDARTMLSAPKRYDRLVVALKYATRDKALSIIDMCITLSRFSMRASQSQEATQQLDRLVGTYEAISQNHNPRLQLLALTLS